MRIVVLLPASLILLALMLCAHSAAQTPLTIVNPDFEIGSATQPPSGWTTASGSNPFWIGSSLVGTANPASGYGGSSKFISGSWEIAGLPNANSLIGGAQNRERIYQDIDLSPFAAQITQGDRYLGLSYAYFINDGNDLGTIDYEFFDVTDAIVGTYNVQAQASASGWQFVENLQAAPVPLNSTRLRISIGAQLNSGGGGSARNVAFDAIQASLQPAPAPEAARDYVHGNLIQFDSDGNWTWYTDERAIVDPNNGRVLVNSVGFDETVQGGGFPGNVDVVNFDPQTGRRIRTRLSNQAENPQIQNDDHNVGALLVLPDGRYLSMYANHGNNGGLGDEFSRWRVSSSPGDSTSWSTEQLYNWYNNVPGANQTGNTEAANVSYHNLFYLSAEDQVYDISRSYGQLSSNGASQNMPNILRYDPDTNSVAWAGQLLETQAGGYSAYPKYASNGVDRIYFITTETHPRNYNNSVYAGYIQGGKTFDMTGNVIDPHIFDNGTAAGGSGFVPDVTDFTLVQQSDPLGQGFNRLWTTDLALDSSSQPMALFTSRWNPDGLANVGDIDPSVVLDHRLHFARWNASSAGWETEELAKMGDRLYGPEQDYTGLGALVPGNENTLYISTPFDPRDPTWETKTEHREIYRGKFNGSMWSWTAITENSSVDNLRPIAPDTHGTGPQTVFWFRGNYTTAHDINAAVVGIVDRDDEQTGLITYVDANASNTRFASGASLSTSAPSAGPGPDDNQWHLRTGVGNGGGVLASNESGDENAPLLKTTVAELGGGLYDVFAYFWSDNDEDWRLLAGLEQNNLIDFRKYGSQFAEQTQFQSIELVSDGQNDLQLYRAYLGRSDVAAGGAIEVYIDDWQTLNGASSRTWYDGIGYALVTPIDLGLAGDFNDDGTVDAADYVVWRDHLGEPNETNLNHRGNGGDVGLEDYAIWKANFGETSPETGRAAQVPEPAAAALLLPLVAGLIATGRKRLAGLT
jgi:hypothetical protein